MWTSALRIPVNTVTTMRNAISAANVKSRERERERERERRRI